MLHAISLASVLFGLWLLLSGHFTPGLVLLGAVSALFVLVIALRMDVVDDEGHPARLGPRVFLYWPWLLWQIVRGNFEVARCIFSPRLSIQPRNLVLRASQKTDIGRVIYANSITLTPGTVTVEIEAGELLVHALTASAAQSLRKGGMDRRVSDLERL